MGRAVYKESIKQWPEPDRPKEKLIANGPAFLSDSELLSIIIGSGAGNKNALDLARDLLNRFDDLSSLDVASVEEIKKVKGIGETKAVTVKAALELARRFAVSSNGTSKVIRTSEDVVSVYIRQMKNMKKEVFKVVLLNVKNKVFKTVTVSEGGLTSSVVHPRDVFSPAIRESAHGVILLHNHPSGDPSPSEEDMMLTRRITEAGRLLHIKILDHIIIGDNRYYSFADEEEL
ncbi:UPF0758 family protein [hydrothermal vent metagenome]|uniref:UPF0758 family protein n=1 Tax=hydrothermal vent metagenome TaxID=652676 RepID=A0A3B1BL06_9ZZZZ